ARVLCVEREKSISVCQGRCYLSDQLKRVAEQQEKETEVNPVEITFFFQKSVSVLATETFSELEIILYASFEDQKQSNPHLKGIFHPPRA
ncbi:MAG: hypothetical protein AAFY41_15525, partial [Bacteroidota bacterium]